MPAFSSADVTDGGLVQASSLLDGHSPEIVTINFKLKQKQSNAGTEHYFQWHFACISKDKLNCHVRS